MEAPTLREVLDDNPVVGSRRGGVRRFWTGPEIKRLRTYFPLGGVEACLTRLPGRTASSIYQRAKIEGVKSPHQATHDFRRQRWHSSPQFDAAIRNVLQGEPKDGEIKRLAKTLGRPKWWVARRARKLGLVPPKFKQPPWTEAEDELIANYAHRTPETIARILKRAGFNRTETAIVVRLKRCRVPRGRNADIDHYSANALAKLFGIDVHAVLGWIAKGWLRARSRPGLDRHEWQVHRRDVKQFVMQNVAAVDFRKVDKFWLVEVLTGAAA